MTDDQRIKQILPPVFVASPDQEAWVRARISDALTMANQIQRARGVAANDRAFQLGLAGIIEGTAIEIIKTLGGEPCYVNLPAPAAHSRLSGPVAGGDIAREAPPAPNPIQVGPKLGYIAERRPGDSHLIPTMSPGPAPGADDPEAAFERAAASRAPGPRDPDEVDEPL